MTKESGLTSKSSSVQTTPRGTPVPIYSGDKSEQEFDLNAQSDEDKGSGSDTKVQVIRTSDHCGNLTAKLKQASIEIWASVNAVGSSSLYVVGSFKAGIPFVIGGAGSNATVTYVAIKESIQNAEGDIAPDEFCPKLYFYSKKGAVWVLAGVSALPQALSTWELYQEPGAIITGPLTGANKDIVAGIFTILSLLANTAIHENPLDSWFRNPKPGLLALISPLPELCDPNFKKHTTLKRFLNHRFNNIILNSKELAELEKYLPDSILEIPKTEVKKEELKQLLQNTTAEFLAKRLEGKLDPAKYSVGHQWPLLGNLAGWGAIWAAYSYAWGSKEVVMDFTGVSSNEAIGLAHGSFSPLALLAHKWMHRETSAPWVTWHQIITRYKLLSSKTAKSCFWFLNASGVFLSALSWATTDKLFEIYIAPSMGIFYIPAKGAVILFTAGFNQIAMLKALNMSFLPRLFLDEKTRNVLAKTDKMNSLVQGNNHAQNQALVDSILTKASERGKELAYLKPYSNNPSVLFQRKRGRGSASVSLDDNEQLSERLICVDGEDKDTLPRTNPCSRATEWLGSNCSVM